MKKAKPTSHNKLLYIFCTRKMLRIFLIGHKKTSVTLNVKCHYALSDNIIYRLHTEEKIVIDL